MCAHLIRRRLLGVGDNTHEKRRLAVGQVIMRQSSLVNVVGKQFTLKREGNGLLGLSQSPEGWMMIKASRLASDKKYLMAHHHEVLLVVRHKTRGHRDSSDT